MWLTIAWAITVFDCGSRNIQASLPGGVPTGEAASCTVAGFGGDVDHRGGDGGEAGADDHVDLVVGDEAARVLRALARVAGVVQDDQVDLLARDVCGKIL